MNFPANSVRLKDVFGADENELFYAEDLGIRPPTKGILYFFGSKHKNVQEGLLSLFILSDLICDCYHYACDIPYA